MIMRLTEAGCHDRKVECLSLSFLPLSAYPATKLQQQSLFLRTKFITL